MESKYNALLSAASEAHFNYSSKCLTTLPSDGRISSYYLCRRRRWSGDYYVLNCADETKSNY